MVKCSQPKFLRTTRYFEKMESKEFFEILKKYGERGVVALAEVTPKRTGKTAASWSYRVTISEDKASLTFINDNATEDGRNIVKLLIQGHGTRNGGYVRYENFVSPTIRAVTDDIVAALAKEVKK